MECQDVTDPNEYIDLYISYGGPKNRLTIGDDIIVIDSNRPIPHWWNRLWMRILLGWKWERLSE